MDKKISIKEIGIEYVNKLPGVVCPIMERAELLILKLSDWVRLNNCFKKRRLSIR